MLLRGGGRRHNSQSADIVQTASRVTCISVQIYLVTPNPLPPPILTETTGTGRVYPLPLLVYRLKAGLDHLKAGLGLLPLSPLGLSLFFAAWLALHSPVLSSLALIGSHFGRGVLKDLVQCVQQDLVGSV